MMIGTSSDCTFRVKTTFFFIKIYHNIVKDLVKFKSIYLLIDINGKFELGSECRFSYSEILN